ncbi:hypothetical protein LP422_19675 [Janibacter limosus]|uniref:Uncharacterized protein n=1 Tax=Janibacter limosus TaxID=53458 RepID=A0AC61U3F5_9MICO|nr:hypothetical protein [Janibacter limosus]UUZ44559.1 hypothetical protein LP422_19675 [Janibacter limosus]
MSSFAPFANAPTEPPTGPDYLFDGGDVDVIVEILHNVESRAQPVGA